MKKIIDGKLYDTEKAELILKFRRRRESSVFRTIYYWAGAELYKTKNGNYFELIGTNPADSRLEMNALTEERAKEIIMLEPDKFRELYPDEVEEA